MTDHNKTGATGPDQPPQPIAAGEALLAAGADSLLVTGLDKILQRQDERAEAQLVPLGGAGMTADQVAATVLLAPNGLQNIPLGPIADAMRKQPKRREGTHCAHTLDAFNAIVNRFKAPNSVIFADQDKSTLTAILDFHPEGPENEDARFARHRVVYSLPFSKEWKAWRESDGKILDQIAFASFIEDRIADVTMPNDKLLGSIGAADAGGDFGTRTPLEDLAYLARTLGGRFATPAELVSLSRGLAIRENLNFKTAENLSTGETTVVFDSQHQDGSGAPLQVPNLFLIAIPVYHAGAVYAIAVRLRYRRDGSKLKWIYQMYRVDQGLDHAFGEAALGAAEATGLPLYRGTI